MEEIKLEKYIKSSPIPIFVEGIETILFQMKSCICKIYKKNITGTGFFCKIPFQNKLLPVLITNNHVLSKDLLESEKYIKITINDENKNISLKQRKIWNNEKMDFTCIEIKEKEDNIHNFLYIDDDVFDKNYSNDYYLGKNILFYGININDNKQVGLSDGIIKKNEDYFFIHNCNAFPGCSGGCIVNKFNNCVIGIHRAGIKEGINQGIYISNVIKCIKNSKEYLLSNVSKNSLNLL